MKILHIALVIILMLSPAYAASTASDVPQVIQAAEQGDASAQYNLGGMYYDGKGVPQDYKQAITWFRKAAEQGHAYAQFSLGSMYHEGNGVPQDYKQAITWFRKAAEQGDASAQYNLGHMYHGGRGVPQDYKQAYAWASTAAANGEKNAFDLRDEAAKRLTPSALSEAQSLASEYFNKYQSQ